MKYVILSYATQQDYDGMAGEGEAPWTPDELETMRAFMTDLNSELAASGELVASSGLAAPTRTRRVATGAFGDALLTDDPYPPTQEVVSAYWVVECDSLERATEIARRINACPTPTHLVRRAYADIRPLNHATILDDA